MSKIVDKVLANLANYTARMAVGTASFFNSYQPKEPQSLEKKK